MEEVMIWAGHSNCVHVEITGYDYYRSYAAPLLSFTFVHNNFIFPK